MTYLEGGDQWHNLTHERDYRVVVAINIAKYLEDKFVASMKTEWLPDSADGTLTSFVAMSAVMTTAPATTLRRADI